MNISLFLKIIGIIIVIYLIIVFYVYSKQRSLLYVPNIDNYDDETLSINANEVFIDSATLRENVVALARNIGYVPRSRKSSRATVSFTVDTSSISPNPVSNVPTL